MQGQAASESDGYRHISGTGGQLQFVRGAYASKGGKSFICLASTYEKRGERRSRIVPCLTKGNIVISIAHPDFHEELERDAYEQRLIPRGFF